MEDQEDREAFENDVDVLVQVALFAIVMGLLGIIFFYIGISLGWLYVRMLSPTRRTISCLSLGIHGCRSRLGSRPDRDVYHLEQGQ